MVVQQKRAKNVINNILSVHLCVSKQKARKAVHCIRSVLRIFPVLSSSNSLTGKFKNFMNIQAELSYIIYGSPK